MQALIEKKIKKSMLIRTSIKRRKV